MRTPDDEHLRRSNLGIFLSAAVPLQILEIKANSGTPTEEMMERARKFSLELGSRGDVLLYGGKKGEAAKLANELAFAVAVLAFCPGGVETFGVRFNESGEGPR